jgi:predicted amidohydrolase
MERFLTNIRTAKGYCLQCGLPSEVVYFRVRGWDYEFGICKDCWNVFFNASATSDAIQKREAGKNQKTE